MEIAVLLFWLLQIAELALSFVKPAAALIPLNVREIRNVFTKKPLAAAKATGNWFALKIEQIYYSKNLNESPYGLKCYRKQVREIEKTAEDLLTALKKIRLLSALFFSKSLAVKVLFALYQTQKMAVVELLKFGRRNVLPLMPISIYIVILDHMDQRFSKPLGNRAWFDSISLTIMLLFPVASTFKIKRQIKNFIRIIKEQNSKSGKNDVGLFLF